MLIGTFYQGDSEEYRKMGAAMIRSAKEVMPDVEVAHFTDDKTQKLEGADCVVRIGYEVPMAVRRMLFHASALGDWLFVDTDVIFRKDVREVFEDRDFDVALTNRDGTITNEAAYARVMPYNIGVTFSRNPGFWKEVLKRMEMLSRRLQHWEGDQRVIADLMIDPEMKFKVKVIPGLIYNYPPKSEDDDLTQVSIAHYKGPRKKWLKGVF